MTASGVARRFGYGLGALICVGALILPFLVNGMSSSATQYGTTTTTTQGGPTGFLRVVTNPAVPSQIKVDGHITDTWGLKWVKEPNGSHQVCFSDVAGYKTPPCQNITISGGQTTLVAGTFVANGYLRVATSPAVNSKITVDGVSRNNWGVWTDIPPGSHEVCFGPVAGFTPPACQQVGVNADTTTNVTGTFTASSATGPSGLGMLRVTSSPPVRTQITVDGDIADSWGLNWLQLSPGGHAVCFSHVEGYTEPSCSNVQVTGGATSVVTGTFAQRGFLKIDTNPAVPGTITVDGIPADDWGDFTDRPVGTYKICFGEVPGRVAPPCQNAPVTAGNLTTISGTYI